VVSGDPVRVLTTSSVPEGEIARARLEDEGIPVLLKGEGEGPYRMGPVHLFVPAELEVQARLILAETLGPDAVPTPDASGDGEAAFDGSEDAIDEEERDPGGRG
jgi:hypothetical protein